MIKLVVFGDSLVAGYNLTEDEAYPAVLETALRDRGYNIEVINAGVSGDTTAGGLSRLDWTLTDKPDYFILELGANDMLRAFDTIETKQNLDAILKTVTVGNNIPVLIMGMKAMPNLGEEYQTIYTKMYEELAHKYHATLYPFFMEGVYGEKTLIQADRMHPNAAGVKVLVKNTLPYVENLLSKKAK